MEVATRRTVVGEWTMKFLTKMLLLLLIVFGISVVVRHGMGWGYRSAHAMSPMMGEWGGMGRRGGMMGMEQRLPPRDPASLPEPDSEGVQLMGRICSRCHNLPSPAMHSREAWGPVLDRMFGRLDHMGRRRSRWWGPTIPDHRERATITDYIERHALIPFDESSVTQGGGRGETAFRETCGSCHALPSPAKYSEAEWPAIIERMKGNMVLMNRPELSAEVLGQIEEFLGRNGRPM